MSAKTVTRLDLYAAVHEKVGLSRWESLSMVETVLKEIIYALATGENVKLSSFGAFIVRKKAERPGRNPKNGAAVTIPPHRVIVFKASPNLKQQINGKQPTTEMPVEKHGSSRRLPDTASPPRTAN